MADALTKKDFREMLGEFTDEVLLPAIERIIDDKIEEKLKPVWEAITALTAEVKEFVAIMKVQEVEATNLKIKYQELEARVRKLETSQLA
jgi:hypothetical protein